jgi:hypothetical protein
MTFTRCDVRDGGLTENWDGWQYITHVVASRSVGYPRRALSQLAGTIIAPTLGCCIVKDGACKVRPNGHMTRCTATTEGHGQERVTHWICACANILSLSRAELTTVIATPTFQLPILQDSACGLSAGGDHGSGLLSA